MAHRSGSSKAGPSAMTRLTSLLSTLYSRTAHLMAEYLPRPRPASHTAHIRSTPSTPTAERLFGSLVLAQSSLAKLSRDAAPASISPNQQRRSLETLNGDQSTPHTTTSKTMQPWSVQMTPADRFCDSPGICRCILPSPSAWQPIQHLAEEPKNRQERQAGRQAGR